MRSDNQPMNHAPLLSGGEPGKRLYPLLLFMSFAFFLNFAAFNAAQSLNGSIAAPTGLSSASFMAIYVVFALFSIPAPRLLSSIGPKSAMALGMAPYVFLSLSFLAPEECTVDSDGICWDPAWIWAVRMAASVLCGLGAPILWTGQGVYLARLADHEHQRQLASRDSTVDSTQSVGEILKAYNGVFFSSFQLSGATGLVGASLVLWLDQSTSAQTVLFIFLTACMGTGLCCVLFLLPALQPVASNTDALPAPAEQPTVLSTLYLLSDPRMLLVVPNIVYNGLSLGFFWYLYNTFVFNTALGTSFVGFGAAAGYVVNAMSTQLLSRAAARYGQMPTMTFATAVQAAFYVCMLWYTVKPAQCLVSGCAAGTSGPCWRMTDGSDPDSFPSNCSPPDCAECSEYDAANEQQCSSGLNQCEWLHGDAEQPGGGDVVFMLVAIAIFNVGDAVWESQVPAVLQTIFDAKSGSQPAAIANLKLWQSLGVGAMFGLAQLNQLKPCVVLLLCSLLLSSAALLYVHTRIVSLDSGKRRKEPPPPY